MPIDECIASLLVFQVYDRRRRIQNLSITNLLHLLRICHIVISISPPIGIESPSQMNDIHKHRGRHSIAEISLRPRSDEQIFWHTAE